MCRRMRAEKKPSTALIQETDWDDVRPLRMLLRAMAMAIADVVPKRTWSSAPTTVV
jgi:hypothetical protein